MNPNSVQGLDGGGVCCFFLSSNSSCIPGSSESELKLLMNRNLIHDHNESKDQNGMSTPGKIVTVKLSVSLTMLANVSCLVT